MSTGDVFVVLAMIAMAVMAVVMFKVVADFKAKAAPKAYSEVRSLFRIMILILIAGEGVGLFMLLN